jgi:hypothetical protein
LVQGAHLNFYWKFPIWSRRDANRADLSAENPHRRGARQRVNKFASGLIYHK